MIIIQREKGREERLRQTDKGSGRGMKKVSLSSSIEDQNTLHSSPLNYTALQYTFFHYTALE